MNLKELTTSDKRKWGLVVFVAALTVAVLMFFSEPPPPDTIVMATGSEDGAYHHYGKLYAEALKAEGIQVKLVTSAGSVDNLDRLSAGEVDIALVQGGTVGARDVSNLHSFGSLYLEPLWVFHKRGEQSTLLTDLRGRRIAVGGEGSGTRAVAVKLLEANGVKEGAEGTRLLPLAGSDALAAMKAGTVDVVMVIAGTESKVVRALLDEPEIQLMSFERRGDAYLRRYRFLSSTPVPRGVISLADDIPQQEAILLAPTATLVARKDFHPALVPLFVDASQGIHGPGGILEEPGHFPSPLHTEIALAEDAGNYYEHGPSFLLRYLPFWAASLLDRLKFMLLPLLTVLIPLVKVAPPLYNFRYSTKINGWYKSAETIEAKLRELDEAERGPVLGALTELRTEVESAELPNSWLDKVYTLRMHLRRLEERWTDSDAV